MATSLSPIIYVLRARACCLHSNCNEPASGKSQKTESSSLLKYSQARNFRRVCKTTALSSLVSSVVFESSSKLFLEIAVDRAVFVLFGQGRFFGDEVQ